jgi:hypothetical protein
MTRLSFVGRFAGARTLAIAASAFLPLLLAAGCGGEETPGPAPMCNALEIIQDPNSCASCHGATGTMGMLVLTGADPASQLIGVQAKGTELPGCAGQGVLIEPDLPARGIFFDKFNAQPSCGKRMPNIGAALTAAQVDCLKAWATQEINKR